MAAIVFTDEMKAFAIKCYSSMSIGETTKRFNEKNLVKVYWYQLIIGLNQNSVFASTVRICSHLFNLLLIQFRYRF